MLIAGFESLSTYQLCCTTLDSAGDEMGPTQVSVCVRQVSKASMSVISLDTGPLSVETSEVLGGSLPARRGRWALSGTLQSGCTAEWVGCGW